MPDPIRLDGSAVLLGSRVFQSATVTGSPAAAAETIVCTLPAIPDLAFGLGVILIGWCTLTVGASGTAITTKLRRTNASGQTIATSGATTATAGNLVDRSISAIDTGPTLPGQVYVMTLTVTAGAAASTVSAATLVAVVV